MTEYKEGDCKCSKCNKIHYCPDGCAMHYTEKRCICTKCYRLMTINEKIKEEEIQQNFKENSK